MAEHCRWLLDNGCTGIVALGFSGRGRNAFPRGKEGNFAQPAFAASGRRGPVVAPSPRFPPLRLSAQAKTAPTAGCDALMVLPPYVYLGDWREMKAHVSAYWKRPRCLACCTTIPSPTAPIFFRSKFRSWPPSMKNLQAVKESSARRAAGCQPSALCWVTGLRCLVGVDDAIVEAISRRGHRLGRGTWQRISPRIRGALQLRHPGRTGKGL